MTNAYASLSGSSLTLGNALIERQFTFDAQGRLFTTRIVDKTINREWAAKPSTIAALLPSGTLDTPVTPALTTAYAQHHPVGEKSLRATLATPNVTYEFEIFDSSASVTQRLLRGPLAATAEIESLHASGIESGAWPKLDPATLRDVLDAFILQPLHLNLTGVELRDQTDLHDNLVFTREYLLHPAAEPLITLAGNLFIFEDRFTGDGLILLKHAPLPHARPIKSAIDLRIQWDLVLLLGHGADAHVPYGYASTLLTYTGGLAGRTAALHQLQRCHRAYDPQREGRFVSNTWGDRNRDGRLSEEFMLQEVAAGEKLGVDVVQIDDGWQRGVTANSVEAQKQNGVWTGFWAANPDFWLHHPTRFPRDVDPVIAAAKQKGMHFGLWFAPDSSNDFANFEKDAAQILKLHREKGVDYIKIDGVKAHSRLAESRLRQFFDLVLLGSNGKVVFDLDVTAEIRPGYFGIMHAGPIFLENRYTDFHRYYPHATLKNLWQLTHYINPSHLRMEFLNNTRRTELYENDPLAPHTYSPDYLFASIMLASPLGWFEVSNLPAVYIEQLAPLVTLWKKHRTNLHTGFTTPIGQRPDGTTFTGFATHCPSQRTAYALVFREVTASPDATLTLPAWANDGWTIHPLAGTGTAALNRSHLQVHLPQPRSFLWLKLTK